MKNFKYYWFKIKQFIEDYDDKKIPKEKILEEIENLECPKIEISSVLLYDIYKSIYLLGEKYITQKRFERTTYGLPSISNDEYLEKEAIILQKIKKLLKENNQWPDTLC